MATNGALKAGGQIIGHQFVPAYQVARFLPHRHRVLKLYKKAWRSISAHNVDAYVMRPYLSTHIMCFEHAVLRARFDENKHVTSLAKATELLKDGEEEFWLNQHYSPDEHGKLPDSPDGMSFQRWAHMMQENNVLNDWGADDWARYPDIYDNYKKWKALRNDTWEEEMRTLEEADAATIAAGGRLSDDFPAAKEVDGPPPFWWRYVTRPLERPRRQDFDDMSLWHND